LIATLALQPALAGPAQPLGVVLQAERAALAGGAVLSGSTVFPGDTLTTDPTGVARVRAGAAQFYLLGNSTVSFVGTAGAPAVEVARGTAGFSSSAAGVEMRARMARIRPQSAQPTHGQVAVVSPKEIVVTSYRGTLEVAVGSEMRLVSEGTAYRVIMEPEPQDPTGTGAAGASTAKIIWVLIAAAVAVGIGIGIWRANISESRP
jgi:hypothetical protein